VAEENHEPVSDTDLAAVSGGDDDQQDPSNWYHKKCPKCHSSNIKVSYRVIGIPVKQQCQDCGYEWEVLAPDEFDPSQGGTPW